MSFLGATEILFLGVVRSLRLGVGAALSSEWEMSSVSIWGGTLPPLPP